MKAGNKSKARGLFIAAIRQNPNNELAWSWIFGLMETDEQRIRCLKEILRINPANIKASQALEKLEAKYSQPPSFDDYLPVDQKPTIPLVGPDINTPRPAVPVKNTPAAPSTVYVGPTVNIPNAPAPITGTPTNPPAPAPQKTLPRPDSSTPAIPPSRPPASPDSSQVRPASSKFTPKRIITALGMIFIIISAFTVWQTNSHIWFNGYLPTSTTMGVDTPAGLVSAGFALFGIILLFAINREKTAHLLCSFCAIIAVIAAFNFLGNANGAANWDPILGQFVDISQGGIGIYMAIFGAALALGCFLIPSHDR